ncbi:MAG: aminoacyl-tRNA hydrolase [Spirochaetes bacterium]|jgi:PTH1 family peptidyl-tRNA hydrolase|nr:aminoacyl-tRNA hydrolase [Spirochaetota bacterium]
MKLIACLGNPGRKYHLNRHNCGFLSGYYMAQKHNVQITKKESLSLTARLKILNEDVLLLLPQTFMNNSGEAVAVALHYYGLNKNDLIVIHDELELSFGDIREKRGGGHKGHNGIRSIISSIGTADFVRIRFGIGRPPHEEMSVASYVLSDFNDDETSSLEECYEKVIALIEKVCVTE